MTAEQFKNYVAKYGMVGGGGDCRKIEKAAPCARSIDFSSGGSISNDAAPYTVNYNSNNKALFDLYCTPQRR